MAKITDIKRIRHDNGSPYGGDIEGALPTISLIISMNTGGNVRVSGLDWGLGTESEFRELTPEETNLPQAEVVILQPPGYVWYDGGKGERRAIALIYYGNELLGTGEVQYSGGLPESGISWR
jgi:hypothetical protein